MNRLICIDGSFHSAEEARISVLDRGLQFGESLFETFVAFDGKILDIESHLTRLRKSAQEVGMDVPWSDEQLRFEVDSVAEQVSCPKAMIKLLITSGDGEDLFAGSLRVARRIVYARPAPTTPPDAFSRGLKLKRKALPFTMRGAQPKRTDYLRSVQAVTECRAAGFDEVLWSNTEGEITEAAAANILFIGRDGNSYDVVTPSVWSGILPGIMRQRVLEICRKSGANVTETVVFADELPRFDEAFLCSTVRGLVPVGCVDQHKLHTTHKGALFAHIQGALEREIWQKLKINPRDWNTGV